MLFRNKIISLLSLISMVRGQGSDYLDPPVAPMTVYEDPIKNPQNMDFDVTQNMFVAHSGWYQDRLVHYYKFRMFTPGTYPGILAPGVTSDAVPLQKIYFVTDTGDFTGVMGKPIIEHHTQDGLVYSDFMIVNFVEAPADYVADTFQSVGDILESGAAMVETNVVLNIPVVPTGATLQHPIDKGTATAPIQPVPVFYRGVEVWTYVFEVSDQTAADFFASTRSPAISPERFLVTGFEIPVLPWFATADRVSAIPIWHVNQFSKGVVEGDNGGGPNPMGMRNIIDMDRPDPGYSPLWQVYWATEMPVNYMVDQLSNAVDATSENGFAFFESPMYVNCPDVGLVEAELNPLKQDEFMATIDLHSKDMDVDSFVITGSHPTLIMQGGIPIKFMTDDGTVLGTTATNGMGGYEMEILRESIPEDAMEVQVIVPDASATPIRTIPVAKMMMDDTDSSMIEGGDIVIDSWSIPADGMPYEPKSVFVGDTITFRWTGAHTVHIYPSMDCDDSTDFIEIGSTTGASYTFQESDAAPEGKTHMFACSVGSGSHCNLGQQIKITVFPMPELGSMGDDDVSAAPRKTSSLFAGCLFFLLFLGL
jgi:plastocyanin